MMRIFNTSAETACKLSWLLVEVQDEKVTYSALHSMEVLGDPNDAYVNRKASFTIGKHERTGVVRLAADSLKAVEDERKRLLAVQAVQSSSSPKTDLWCLVRQTSEESYVRLTIVSCKKLTCTDGPDLNRKHFLMQTDQGHVPVMLLHILDKEQQLNEEIAYLNDMFSQTFLSEEKDQLVELGGLDDAYFLVQYFEDASNLIYTIVKYSDTVWKERNFYPNVVAYIAIGSVVSQGVILRKSYQIEELQPLLSEIRDTCDNVDYPLLYSELKKADNADVPCGS